MAQIKDLAVGDGFVYLTENGVKTKFYLLAHDYESGLNGAGRALFVRESPVTNGKFSTMDGFTGGWGDSLSYANLYYNAISRYMENDYWNLFSADVKKWISTTKFYVYRLAQFAITCQIYTGTIFTVSMREAVVNLGSSGRTEDGTLLSYEARKRLEQIYSAYGSIWTRTVSSSYSKKDDDGNKEYSAGYYLNGVSDREWGVFSYTSGSSYSSCGYLPCFTLPETLYVTDEGFATVNQPPELTSTAGKSGTDLGEKNAPFALIYAVTDKDGDAMTVTEKLDGVEKAVHTGVVSGTALSVAWLNEKDSFQQIVNGSHTLTIAVDDTKNTVEWQVTFTKITTEATLRMTDPMTSDSAITVAAMTLEGTFPADILLTVEMTNNGLDDDPVWEKCTQITIGTAKAFIHHAFKNSTSKNGPAFNYRIQLARSSTGESGNLTMIGGAFA